MSSPKYTSTKIKTSYPDLSDRQNPEFKQTALKYLNQKKQRKQLDKRKLLVSNQVKHQKKLNNSLQKSLQNKEKELQWLKQVRERYLTSIQNKKNRQEQQRRKLQELRMQNTTMRQRSIENINDALDKLHRKKSKAHNQVLKNLTGLKHRYSVKQAAIDESNHSTYLSMRRSRVKGKNKVNKFFQKKSTQLTRLYKSMAHHEQQAFISGVHEIQELHMRESRYKQKISKKQTKIQKILSEIDELKKSSHQIAMQVMRSSRYDATLQPSPSKISKASKTQRSEQQQQQGRYRRHLGFNLVSIGSKQFIDDKLER